MDMCIQPMVWYDMNSDMCIIICYQHYCLIADEISPALGLYTVQMQTLLETTTCRTMGTCLQRYKNKTSVSTEPPTIT